MLDRETDTPSPICLDHGSGRTLFYLNLAHFEITTLVPLYKLAGVLLQRTGQLLASGVALFSVNR